MTTSAGSLNDFLKSLEHRRRAPNGMDTVGDISTTEKEDLPKSFSTPLRPNLLAFENSVTSGGNGETPTGLHPPQLGHEGMDVTERRAAIDHALKWLQQEMRAMKRENGTLKSQMTALCTQVHTMKIDALRELATRRHSFEGSVSLMDSTIMEDTTLEVPNGHVPAGYWTNPRPRRHGSERSLSLPPGSPGTIQRYINASRQLKDLQSPDEEEEKLLPTESTPLPGVSTRNCQKLSVGDGQFRSPDMPSPIRIVLDITDGPQEEESSKPPLDDKTATQKEECDSVFASLPHTTPTPDQSISLKDDKIPSTSATDNVPQETQQTEETHQSSIATISSSKQEGGTLISESETTPSHSQSGSPPNSAILDSEEVSESGNVLTPTSRQPRRQSTIRRRQPASAKARQTFIERQRQQVMAAAETLNQSQSSKSKPLRRNMSETATSDNTFQGDDQIDGQELSSSMSLDSSRLASFRQKQSATTSYDCQEDLDNKNLSPSGLIEKKKDSADFCFGTNLKRQDILSGSLPSVRDVSPSGRFHQRKGSADFTFNPEWSQRSSSPSEFVGPPTMRSSPASTTCLSRTDRPAVPPRSVETALSVPDDIPVAVPHKMQSSVRRSSSARSAQPFWQGRPTQKAETTTTPAGGFLPEVAALLSQPRSIKQSNNGTLHQRTASMPVSPVPDDERNLEKLSGSREALTAASWEHPAATHHRLGTRSLTLDVGMQRPTSRHIRQRSADLGSVSSIDDRVFLSPSVEDLPRTPGTATDYKSRTLPRKSSTKEAHILREEEHEPVIQRSERPPREVISSDNYRSNTLPRKIRLCEARVATKERAGSPGFQAHEATHSSNGNKRHSGPETSQTALEWTQHATWGWQEQHISPPISPSPDMISPSTSLPGSPSLLRRKSSADLRATAMRRAQQAAAAVEVQAAARSLGIRRSSDQVFSYPQLYKNTEGKQLSMDISQNAWRARESYDNEEDASLIRSKSGSRQSLV